MAFYTDAQKLTLTNSKIVHMCQDSNLFKVQKDCIFSRKLL